MKIHLNFEFSKMRKKNTKNCNNKENVLKSYFHLNLCKLNFYTKYIIYILPEKCIFFCTRFLFNAVFTICEPLNYKLIYSLSMQNTVVSRFHSYFLLSFPILDGGSHCITHQCPHYSHPLKQ